MVNNTINKTMVICPSEINGNIL